jgi:hypothetical protein
VSVEILVLLVPVFFGMMGFAIDLGQLYLIRSELKAAANSMALAAASKLIGTDAAADAATTAARLTIENSSGYGNKYNFSGLTIGETSGLLSSEAPDPTYYASVVDALGTDASSGSAIGGAGAKHVRISLKADAPLTFWSFLPLAQERKINIQVQAVAGVSAPLCTACGIEPLAIAPVDSSDTVDYGFVLNQRYTFAYSCSGGGGTGNQPGLISGTVSPIVSYILLDRYNLDATVFPDEFQQAYRIGAAGMPGSTVSGMACVRINSDGEAVWVTAVPTTCGRLPQTVQSVTCGLAARLENTAPTICSTITDVDTILSIYQPDPDVTDLDDYASYTGNGRRIITVPIVDALNPDGGMIAMAFRQFLLEPNPSPATNLDPSDTNGRFVALYIGSVMPLKQGAIGGCPQQTNGPGKVVLHQ